MPVVSARATTMTIATVRPLLDDAGRLAVVSLNVLHSFLVIILLCKHRHYWCGYLHDWCHFCRVTTAAVLVHVGAFIDSSNTFLCA